MSDKIISVVFPIYLPTCQIELLMKPLVSSRIKHSTPNSNLAIQPHTCPLLSANIYKHRPIVYACHCMFGKKLKQHEIERKISKKEKAELD